MNKIYVVIYSDDTFENYDDFMTYRCFFPTSEKAEDFIETLVNIRYTLEELRIIEFKSMEELVEKLNKAL